MVITLDEIGRRLRRARESRQITQESASEVLGLQRSAISLMESGHRQISTLELTRLADLYGRSVEWFVNPNIPVEQEDPVVALFRADPGLQSEVVQKQASRCLRLLREGASDWPYVCHLPAAVRVAGAAIGGTSHCAGTACGRAGTSKARLGQCARKSTRDLGLPEYLDSCSAVSE